MDSSVKCHFNYNKMKGSFRLNCDEELNYINAKSPKEHILNTTVLATDNTGRIPGMTHTKKLGKMSQSALLILSQKFSLIGYCEGILYFVRLGMASQMK